MKHHMIESATPKVESRRVSITWGGNMRETIIFIFMFTTFIFSGSISISKDSLKVCNNLSSSPGDYLIIANHSEDSIALDSAYIIIDSMDTTGMTDQLMPEGKLEAFWREPSNKSDFGWHLDEIETNTCKLTKDYFYPNDALPLRCAPDDSCDMHDFMIGIYLVSAHYPIYPNYLKGSLLLYFNNQETLTVKLYSDDLRTDVISERRAMNRINSNCSVGYVSLNGKRIKNTMKQAKNMHLFYSKENKGLAGKTITIESKRPQFLRIKQE